VTEQREQALGQWQFRQMFLREIQKQFLLVGKWDAATAGRRKRERGGRRLQKERGFDELKHWAKAASIAEVRSLIP
jgi:hypothetical protein